MPKSTLPLGPLYALLQAAHGDRGDYAEDVSAAAARMTRRLAAEGDTRPGRVVEVLLEEARAGMAADLQPAFDAAWAELDTEENRSYMFLGYQAEAMLRVAIERQRQAGP